MLSSHRRCPAKRRTFPHPQSRRAAHNSRHHFSSTQGLRAVPIVGYVAGRSVTRSRRRSSHHSRHRRPGHPLIPLRSTRSRQLPLGHYPNDPSGVTRSQQLQHGDDKAPPRIRSISSAEVSRAAFIYNFDYYSCAVSVVLAVCSPVSARVVLTSLFSLRMRGPKEFPRRNSADQNNGGEAPLLTAYYEESYFQRHARSLDSP